MADLYNKLHSACKSGDAEFVSRCIADNVDRGRDIDWRDILCITYKYNHTAIVQCIQDSGRLGL